MTSSKNSHFIFLVRRLSKYRESRLEGGSKRGETNMKYSDWIEEYMKAHPQFTGKCVCGNILEIAYNPDLKITFWNCFECLPMFERVHRIEKKKVDE